MDAGNVIWFRPTRYLFTTLQTSFLGPTLNSVHSVPWYISSVASKLLPHIEFLTVDFYSICLHGLN